MGVLSPAQVSKLVRAGLPGLTSDGDNLYLRIRNSGHAGWLFRYRYAGRDVWLPLGGCPDMSIAEARREARERRVLLDRGKDPLAERRAQEALEGQRGGFGKLANDWYAREIEAKYAHPEVVRRVLDKHILPKLGRKSLEEIRPADCERVLAALRDSAPTVANDVLRYMQRIFGYAQRRHLLDRSPVADFDAKRDAGGIESKRDRALSGEELVALFQAMRNSKTLGGDNALAIKLMLATCVRKSELLAARWSEFDLEGRTLKGPVWRLPAERTKTGTEIDIPLVPRVVEWLRALRALSEGSEFVFPLRRRDSRARAEHVGRDTLNVALSRVKHGLQPFTLHDLRRTARTHLAALGVRTEVAEKCLNHKLSGVLGIYDRFDYYPERRRALTLWTEQLVSFDAGKSEVVALADRSRSSETA